MGKIITFVFALLVIAFIANYYGYVDIPILDPPSSEQTHQQWDKPTSPQGGQTQKNKGTHKAIDDSFTGFFISVKEPSS